MRCGRKLQELPANLGADAAGAAGDQYHPAIDPPADVLDVPLHRFALQEVLDRDRPGLDGHASLDQLPVVGQHADLAGAVADIVDKRSQGGSAEFPLHDHDLLDSMAFDQWAGVVAGSQHGYAFDACSHQFGIGVEEADDLVSRPADAADHAQSGGPHVARPRDQHAHLAGGRKQRPACLAHSAQQRARSAQHDDRCAPVQQEHAARNWGKRAEKELDQRHRCQTAGGRLQENDQVVEGDRSEPPLTRPQSHEPRQLDQRHPGRRGGKASAFGLAKLTLEAQPVAEEVDAHQRRQQRSSHEQVEIMSPIGRLMMDHHAPVS